MISALREGAKSGFFKFILFSFLILAVGGLVLMDVGGFFRGGAPSTSVAKIGGQEIPTQVFDRTLRRILSQQGIDMQTAYQLGFINQILQSEISANLVRRAAFDEGLLIGDEILKDQITRIISPFVTEDLSAKEALRRILMSQNMSEQEFLQSLRTEMSNATLRNSILLGTYYVSPREAMDLYQHTYEKRTISAVLLPDNKIKDYAEATDEVLLPFYQVGQERYALPETRNLTMAILSDKILKDTLEISEEELRATYEDEIAAYSMPEKRVLQQTIISTQNMAQSIADKVTKGATLQKAVLSITGDKSAYLGEESFEQDGLPEEIAAPVFTAAAGDLIGPVQTALGWHVLKLKAIQAPSVKPFKSVKADLEDGLRQDKLMDEMFAMAGNIDDRLASGMSLEEVTEEMGLSIVQIGPLREDGSAPDDKDALAAYEDDRIYLLESAFEMMEGETSPVMEISEGRYVALRLDTITPKDYTPFDDVKKDLRKLWIADQQQALNKHHAQQALQALLGGEKKLSAFGKVKRYDLERAEDAPKPMTGQGKNTFFTLRQGEFMVVPANGGLMIGRVDSVTLPDTSKLSDEKIAETQKAALGRQKNEALMSYLAYLQEKHEVTINQRALDTLYGPGNETQ